MTAVALATTWACTRTGGRGRMAVLTIAVAEGVFEAGLVKNVVKGVVVRYLRAHTASPPHARRLELASVLVVGDVERQHFAHLQASVVARALVVDDVAVVHE